MSYDYNGLVSEIESSRRKSDSLSSSLESMDGEESAELFKTQLVEQLQQSTDTFATLSEKCPMTPLLWMQYANDTRQLITLLSGEDDSAKETELQMLELALAEFPGCAILHLRYLGLLCAHHPFSENQPQSNEKVLSALESSLDAVGSGSHRNEGAVIASIYRLDATYRVAKSASYAFESFYRRAKVPLKDENDSIMSELVQFASDHNINIPSDAQSRIDSGRRYEAKTFGSFRTFEDEIDASMHAEGILYRHQVDVDDINWDHLLKSDGKTLWMGCGGYASASSFAKYAQCCARYRIRSSTQDEEEVEDAETERSINRLAIAIYERGIAECPIVESLWLSYIRYLTYLLPKEESIHLRLQNAVDRSVRNCPYSVALYQQKLNSLLVSSEAGKSVLDPDALMAVVQEAMDAKFIVSPEACLNLYMAAVKIVKQRVLALLAGVGPVVEKEKRPLRFDETEPVIEKESPSVAIDDGIREEIQDLCDDLREMYDEIDAFLRKNCTGWSEGRALLWLDRSQTESHVIAPLQVSLSSELDDTSSTGFHEIIRCYGKLTKVHQPVHPDCYLLYIRDVLSQPTPSIYHVVSRLRQVRFLYHKSIRESGRPKSPSQLSPQSSLRGFDIAFNSLCDECIRFEKCFGSEQSLSHAQAAIEKKLEKLKKGSSGNVEATTVEAKSNPDQEQVVPIRASIATNDAEPEAAMQVEILTKNETTNEKKRNADESVSRDDPEPKRVKLEDDKTQRPPSLESTQKVKVGNLEYAAHPFTVRVSNLSSETEDMDLVDTFKSKVGPIVHAKIIREKTRHQGKGKSKGWGLVQFEESDSVEKAVQLSEMIGIGEKLIKIDRSHMPAAGIVPPGMHRVNPKGEGKVSKRNQKRKEKVVGKTSSNDSSAPEKSASGLKQENKDTDDTGPSQNHAAPTVSALSFRPRSVKKGAGK